MAAKKRGLGRGLDALLGGAAKEGEQGAAETAAPGESLGALPVDLIQRGRYQPRRDFNPESLQELADSIAAQGVVQPIVVRPVEGGRYEIIAGERRWRATQQAGLDEIPVVIRDVPDQTAMAMGLIENIQRDDLNPLEEATALHRLLNEFELTHQQIAQAVGKSRTTVTNLLRLLDLNEDVKTFIVERRLEMGHARALLGIKDEPQSKAARQVVAQGLSVRETEKLVRRLQGEEPVQAKTKTTPKEDPNVVRLENDLTEKLGARVKIQQGNSGKGKLVISYNSLDELDGILDHIQ
ncbi:ParB/RepB/Spo0J family partition protein [Solemya velesiana gill symbiont]|uniref:Probable chromosome-partitioning protein ParB n=1 Tax=Solemya velesiana gill symbiont TaxID=1918948 RepID=A0A1T2KXP3_9GAMM|nr:ParB/RepB/Spo0J family partition protein [Solemya velesiana gill symbiont]OOZ37571.1 chromosome partitioning protein ParB [Solemya velesiana gill symbiont]